MAHGPAQAESSWLLSSQGVQSGGGSPRRSGRLSGPYGSPESRERYAAAISQWQAIQSEIPQPTQELERDPRRLLLTLSEVLADYQTFAKQYYSSEGRPTKEYVCQRDALRPLRALYGSTIASEFGPLKLKAVRQHLIDQGLCRKLINSRINRIRRFFKWAVSEELIPAAVFEGLRTVDGLRFGRTTAKESPPIRPVEDAVVEATIKHTSPQVAAMIRLQRLTGMRPGEVVLMRGADIDRGGEIWIYEPLEHKNRWWGHQRQIPFGPQAQ